MVQSNNAIYNTVGASISGVTNTLTITNPSNTASSAARETIVVGGGSAGDPTLNFNVSGATNWEMGIDNSVSDNLTISQGTALGTNDTWRMTTGGNNTKPLNCAFLCILTNDLNNVTGDGTNYQIVFDTLTYDQNSNITLANTSFSAPVTGIYQMSANLRISSTTLQNSGNIRFRLNTPSTIYNLFVADGLSGHFGTMDYSGTVNIMLTAGDVVYLTQYVDMIAKNVNIRGVSVAAVNSWWAGALLC